MLLALDDNDKLPNAKHQAYDLKVTKIGLQS